jgi:ADP-ribose pyrophosphatase YjhB (NUDIX family)
MENQILNLFLYNHNLKFNEIEKEIKVRSNKLAYHLRNLVKKKIISKENEKYNLSNDYEHLIPYISNKDSVLPVILIAIKNKENIFLIERNKRPFKGKLSLPGGRVLLGENIKEAMTRIMKEKFSIKCKMQKINSVSMEHVIKNKKIIHSFLLILVTAKTKDKIKYCDIKNSKSKIISSDLNLIKRDIKKKMEIKNIKTKG